jgi:putative two-component system response regulator
MANDKRRAGGQALSGCPDDTVLVVDDEPVTARLLEQILIREGHRVIIARNGLEALELVEQANPDLVLLDLRLPLLGGQEVCRRLKQNPDTRWIPVVVVTGQDDAQAKLSCWEIGADDFLIKPFQCAEIAVRCRSLLRVKRLIEEFDSAEAVVFAFARAVEAKSPYTHGHSERVQEYALLLAEKAQLAEPDQEMLRKGTLLHDIGKISLPDTILNKPGPLTPDEVHLVRQHTIQGMHIVEPLRSIRSVIPLIRWHHERFDGRGYPDGLAAQSIPAPVRVLSIADVFDALASRRPYRPALPHGRCLETLRRGAQNGAFDPDLTDLFCEVMADGVDSALEATAEVWRGPRLASQAMDSGALPGFV